MNKPTIYLDTNVISAYWYEGTDIISTGRRIATREWWETERQHFTLWVSDVTEDELETGGYRRQDEALAMARRLRYLPMVADVYKFAEQLVAKRVVPASKPGDALQMAMAAVHSVDYLLTWNYAHLANPVAQGAIKGISPKSPGCASWKKQRRPSGIARGVGIMDHRSSRVG